ncbi:MAG: HPr family phosphocarrier protein [Catonella sp.]|nr:HPr family phosphocarrier protein [Catonella sp.]MDY6357250.1 HPr family phosphocarrier protein [Catonella sp.]
MLSKTVKVSIKDNEDSRPIALLVQLAEKFSSAVLIGYGNKKINAKSIMGMMTLDISDGDELTIETDGVDEEDAMTEIEEYLKASCII